MSSFRWNTTTTYGSRLFLMPLASVILMVSLPLAAGVCEPLDGLGVSERLTSPLPLPLRLPEPLLPVWDGCAAESALVGVEGPLLKAFVSTLTLSNENHPFRLDRAELARELGGVGGGAWVRDWSVG